MNKMKFGDRFKSKSGLWFWVVNYIDSRNVTIEFDITKSRMIVHASHIKKGTIKDKMTASVYGVGYAGLGIYIARQDGKRTKAYQIWSSMLERCYNEARQAAQPTYKGCVVCDEWHNFQVFAEWFYSNYKAGLHLDKDIKGNGKLYSSEACCFVTNQENCEKALAKNYVFVSPEGVIVNVYNLTSFCRANELDQSHMTSVSLGGRQHHKGWKRPKA